MTLGSANDFKAELKYGYLFPQYDESHMEGLHNTDTAKNLVSPGQQSHRYSLDKSLSFDSPDIEQNMWRDKFIPELDFVAKLKGSKLLGYQDIEDLYDHPIISSVIWYVSNLAGFPIEIINKISFDMLLSNSYEIKS